MNKPVPIVLLLAGLTSADAALAAGESSLAARMAECFRVHHQLMEKPAVQNERACWHAHAYLMERR